MRHITSVLAAAALCGGTMLPSQDWGAAVQGTSERERWRNRKRQWMPEATDDMLSAREEAERVVQARKDAQRKRERKAAKRLRDAARSGWDGGKVQS